MFSLTKQAQTCAIFDECFLCRNFQSHDRGKQELYQMVYHQNRTCVHCYLSIEQCKVAPSINMYTQNINNVILFAQPTSLPSFIGKSQGLKRHQDEKQKSSIMSLKINLTNSRFRVSFLEKSRILIKAQHTKKPEIVNASV